MDYRSKFNLIKSIGQWKEELSKSGALTNDNILELESHLIDEIEQLDTLELNEEECFLIAKKRIGQLDTLKSEYQKVNVLHSFSHRIEPYLKGILVYLSCLSIVNILVYGFYLINVKQGLGFSHNAILIGLLGGLIIASIAIVKSPKANSMIHRLNNIFILFMILIISKPIEFFIYQKAPQLLDMEVYAMSRWVLLVFQIILFASILIGTFLIVLKKKRSNQLIIQS